MIIRKTMLLDSKRITTRNLFPKRDLWCWGEATAKTSCSVAEQWLLLPPPKRSSGSKAKAKAKSSIRDVDKSPPGPSIVIASRLFELRSSVVSVLRSLIASRESTRLSYWSNLFLADDHVSELALTWSRVGLVLQYLQERPTTTPSTNWLGVWPINNHDLEKSPALLVFYYDLLYYRQQHRSVRLKLAVGKSSSSKEKCSWASQIALVSPTALYSGFSSVSRMNLSPFTKDFRGPERNNESLTTFSRPWVSTIRKGFYTTININ